MARRVRTKWRWLKKNHPQVYADLVASRRMTSSQTLNRLKKHKIKPVITLNKLRKMAHRKEKASGIPIKVTKDMTTGHRYADGLTIRESTGNVQIRLHPVLRFHDRRYIKDVMGHEVDHAKVDKRVVRNYEKRWGKI
ncbi:hypothetical protein LCGC14_1556020 [marine sediment metagenome]|uniref:Uncharacterized protein n=1 Tax=marine sediment metagenome TaxID=412755 RepID=A0A0F9LPR6_9ZZZZ